MTVTTPATVGAAQGQARGLPSLGPEGTRLLRLLDDTFESWGVTAGARPMTMPPLLPAADLAKLDYYDNFPHQAVLAAPLDLEGRVTAPFDGEQGHWPAAALEPAALGLPSASCYAVYLDHQGTQVADDTLVTICSWCFRKETHYEGMRRQLGFRMREIVAIGGREHAETHLADFTARIHAFAAALDLPLHKEAACDPFFDKGGSKALLQRLTPVKHEFLYEDLAIASVNTHRNFFGDRCDITLESTGGPAFTSCVAFGLERWLSALTRRHGSWESARRAVLDANARMRADASGAAGPVI
ncbi:seryl-tRNA synthetase [Streptomyces exfoliatus]|uniref:seryl-tRNA synthetase n=1 Tax=Streptomyces TaxID=1883 RepID=UPI0004C7CB26|nr:seryl-tRNA synthetase [Streptomyces exfoliatus]